MHLSRRRTDMQMIRTHPQKAARRILPPTGGQNPKKAFPASARRIALQNAAATADLNRSIACPHGARSQSQHRSLKNAPYAAVSRLRSPAGTAVRKFPKCRSSCSPQTDSSVYSARCPAVLRGIAFCTKKHPGNGRRRSADRAPSREPEPRLLSPSYYTRFRRCRQVRIEKNAQKGCFVLKFT